jgi:hypothetical protein
MEDIFKMTDHSCHELAYTLARVICSLTSKLSYRAPRASAGRG